MTQFDYVARGTLYFLIAVIPIIDAGIMTHLPPLHIALGALAAGLIALRAFIDKSTGQRDDTKAVERGVSTATVTTTTAPPSTTVDATINPAPVNPSATT